MEQARGTGLGQAVVWAIVSGLAEDGDESGWMLDAPEGADFGALQPVFQPFFPAWEKLFPAGPAEARPGLYVFKVTMTDRRAGGAVWRRLAVPGGMTLGHVADEDPEAFDFTDTMQLYEFRFRDRLGRGREYHHYETDEGPYADEVEVSELNLPDGAELAFRSDYGDNWRFELRLERVDEPTSGKTITLLESVGEAPEQYPEWS